MPVSIDQSSPTSGSNGTDRYSDVNNCAKTQVDDDKKKSGCTPSLSLLKISALIVHLLEALFYRIGLIVGRHPLRVVFLSFIGVGLCSLGFLRFTEENRVEKLWVPSTADSLVHMDWVDKHFPSKYHTESLICVANTKSTNVLTSEPIRQLLFMHDNVLNITVDHNGTEYKFNEMCFKRGGRCWVDSILAVWNFDNEVIDSLSNQQILDSINRENPHFPKEYIKRLLGQVVMHKKYIEDAAAFLVIYRINDRSTIQRGAKVDEIADKWESRYIQIGYSEEQNISCSVYTTKTIENETAKSFAADSVLLSIGYVIILIFVSCALGRLNRLENRNIVAAMGMVCIGMAYAAAVGVSSAFGLVYGPLHAVLPFLLLGIGVDDMFVIATAWDNYKHHIGDKEIDIIEHAGQCLKKAGVSITVTSLTDVVAFTIGASTVLPALSSFSIFAGIGILSVFILQVTFFTACIVLDSKRKAANRDACLPCIRLKKKPKGDKKSWSSKIFDGGILRWFFGSKFAPFLMKGPNKFFVVLITLDLVAVSIYGSIELKVSFDPRWFLLPDSYANKFVQYQEKYFPEEGAPVAVYVGQVDYFSQQKQLVNLNKVLKNEKSVQRSSVISWYDDYITWIKNIDFNKKLLDEDGFVKNKTTFYEKLHSFLNSVGRHYSQDVVFDDDDPEIITASRFHAVHKLLTDSTKELEALDSIRTRVAEVTFSPYRAFAFSKHYHLWETNRVLTVEMFRNIGLAIGCVFVITLILVADLRTTVFVIICVTLTLIDMGGLMYFWELSINTVTTIVLVLVVGLSVDYAAHMAHTFMRYQGTRKERVLATMGDMAPAVFNGGFSTFLAFVLLAGSTNYGFLTFFKMFFGVVVFGLFHGLCFLPVLLSWIGADSYPSLSDDNPLKSLACGSCKCWMTFSRIMKNFFCKKRKQRPRAGIAVVNTFTQTSIHEDDGVLTTTNDIMTQSLQNKSIDQYSSGVGSTSDSSLYINKFLPEDLEITTEVPCLTLPNGRILLTARYMTNNSLLQASNYSETDRHTIGHVLNNILETYSKKNSETTV